MKSLKPFALVIVCIIASTTVYADMDLSGVVDVIRKTPANNDFVLPSDSRFERKWQNFTKAVKGNARHNIGDAFVLIDTTVMGACDEGVLIDRLGITVQHDFSDDNGFIPWVAFVSNGTVSQEEVFGDELILFKNPKIVAHFEKSDFKIDNARAFFNRLLIAIRNSQNEAQISPSVSSSQRQIKESSQANIEDIIFSKRINKFGGFYLGGTIKLPDSIDADFGSRQSDLKWVEHGAANFCYDEKYHLIKMADTIPALRDNCKILRYTYITPKARLVHTVLLDFMGFSENVDALYESMQDEVVKAVGFMSPIPVLKKFMEDGEVKVDNGKQLLVFQKKDETVNGKNYTDLYVRVIDLKSLDTEKSFVQTQAIGNEMKTEATIQRWIDTFISQPPFKSFCGIEFGSRLTGDFERTEDGRYLCGYVELDTPFRGCDTAIVYASVKSHRIFKVELHTKDKSKDLQVLHNVVKKRYHPVDEDINKFYMKEDYKTASSTKEKFVKRLVAKGYGWHDSTGEEYNCGDANYHLNGGFVKVTTRVVGTGDYYKTVEEHGKYAFPVALELKDVAGVLIATNYKYEKLADEEYQKESGGDGSGVL